MAVKPFSRFGRFWRRELRWQNLWFVEKNPTKFATTAWLQSQLPFMVYRIVCFVYCASILSWSIYNASQFTSEHDVATWFLSYSVWGFMLFAVYNTLTLLLTGLNFNYDCLCNDDMSWYHKASWVLHVVTFNSAASCLFGTIIYSISRVTNDNTGMTLTEAFQSDDINFYIICALVMAIDVFVCSIPIRFLHFVYAAFFFVTYVLTHVYRWAAGYVPTHTIFAFATLPPATIVLFVLFTVFVYIPLVHLLAYGIDSMRQSLILKVRTRHKREILHAANSSISPLTPEISSVQNPASSIRYKTSSLRPRMYVSSRSKGSDRPSFLRGTEEKYRMMNISRQTKTERRPCYSGYAERTCRETSMLEESKATDTPIHFRDAEEKYKTTMSTSQQSEMIDSPCDAVSVELKYPTANNSEADAPERCGDTKRICEASDESKSRIQRLE